MWNNAYNTKGRPCHKYLSLFLVALLTASLFPSADTLFETTAGVMFTQ